MKFESFQNWVKETLLKNRWLKLFSLVAACLIYFGIRAGISDVRTVIIPVEIDSEVKEANAKNGAVVASFSPQSVQLTVRGSFEDVSMAERSSVRCFIRPRWKKNALADSMKLAIGRSNLKGIPRSLKILKIEPQEAIVQFDIPMSVQLPVATPILEGKARGRVELTCAVTNAFLRGPQRLLKTVDRDALQIQTEPINVDGKLSSFTVPVRLLPPGDFQNATVEPASMDVSVKISVETATRHMDLGRVIISQPISSTTQWKVEPEWVNYDIKGRSEVINEVQDGQILFSVDGNRPVTSDKLTNEVPVRIHVQQGVSVDDIVVAPPTVKLIAIPAPLPPPTEAKPAEAKPAEPPAAAAKPAEAKPVEPPAAAAKPAEAKPAEPPAAAAKPAEAKPAEPPAAAAKPAEAKPAEQPAAAAKPAEAKPVEPPAAAAKPAEAKPAEPPAAAAKPAEAKPAEPPAAAAKPAEAKPAEQPAAAAKPAEAPKQEAKKE
ncbi:MAG: hypothetical protein IJR99_17360 [Kiritimatiellae bacterium]|nr:hypothetical protein [Kiritimatiellia bacterium]